MIDDYGHDQVPENPVDGQVFTCSRCGDSCTFVEHYGVEPGEWVWK